MHKHVFDHQHPSSTGDLQKFAMIQRKTSPARNTLALQRRSKALNTARRVEQFVKLAKRQD